MESLADLGLENPNPSNLNMSAAASDWGGVDTSNYGKNLVLDDVGIDELAVIYKLEFYNGDWPQLTEFNFDNSTDGSEFEAHQCLWNPEASGNYNIGGGTGFEAELQSETFIDGVTWSAFTNFGSAASLGDASLATWAPERERIFREREARVYLHDEMQATVFYSSGNFDNEEQAEYFWRVWYDTVTVEDDLLLELLRQS